jgi:hypothetical protein
MHHHAWNAEQSWQNQVRLENLEEKTWHPKEGFLQTERRQ